MCFEFRLADREFALRLRSIDRRVLPFARILFAIVLELFRAQGCQQ